MHIPAAPWRAYVRKRRGERREEERRERRGERRERERKGLMLPERHVMTMIVPLLQKKEAETSGATTEDRQLIKDMVDVCLKYYPIDHRCHY